MKRTLRTKIWCGVLVVACVSGVAFGVANLPRVQADTVSERDDTKMSSQADTSLKTAKDMFEEEFAASSKLDFSKFAKVVRGKDGSFSLENEDGSAVAENDRLFTVLGVSGGKALREEIVDVHLSDQLEYGLTPADNENFVPWMYSGRYPWLETCELNEDGTLSSPHYAFAYVTIRFENTGKAESSFLSGAYRMAQYNTDGCILDTYECTTDKRELLDGKVELASDNPADIKSGKVVLQPGQAREVTFTYLVSDEFAYPILDTVAAEESNIQNYITMVRNFAIDTYEETDCQYTVEVYGSCGPVKYFDVSDIVNDFFTEHK